MLNDLSLQDAPVHVKAAVCIIGGGTVGLFLARQLRLQGLPVVVLEAGARVARKPEEIDHSCDQRGIRYRGADLGRSFGLGGTSALWGGQLLPLTRADLEARPELGFVAWPISYEEVAAHIPVVRQALGLDEAGVSVETADADVQAKWFPVLREFGTNFKLRLSTWIPFKKRNFAIAFGHVLRKDADLFVWLNASVVAMTRSATSKRPTLETVTAQSANGRTLSVRADIVVVCAGALESTRLLLAYDEATEGSITASGAPLGRYFADHISVPCGRISCRDLRRLNLALGAIFQRGLMRSPRLELSARAQHEKVLTSAFAHFTFVTNGDTGFDVVREILSRRQGNGRRLQLTPAQLCRAISDIVTMATWKLIYKRLWIPRQADLLLNVDIEQAPNPDSRLSLTDDRDRLGRKRLAIDWRITPADVRVIRQVAALTAAAWLQSPLSEFAELQLTLPETFDTIETLYDVYHPTGSLRMGTTPANSVVDKDLRLWAASNCYVSTTAVFPSAGSANPGLMHLALTARLAAHIGYQLRKY